MTSVTDFPQRIVGHVPARGKEQRSWHLARVALAMGSGVDTETVPIGGFQDTVVGNVVLWDDESAQQLWDSMK